MKKRILTFGLFVALLFGATSVNAQNAQRNCANFLIICEDGSSHIGLVCGSSLSEMLDQMDEWIDILC